MKILSEFSIFLSHGQIAVFDRFLADPFAPLEETGLHHVIVDDGGRAEDPLPAAVRVIDASFQVPPSGKIEIASISDSAYLDLDPGLYQLRFQNLKHTGDDEPEIRLSFCPSTSPTFEVVRADAGLRPGQILLLTASPA